MKIEIDEFKLSIPEIKLCIAMLFVMLEVAEKEAARDEASQRRLDAKIEAGRVKMEGGSR